MKEQLIKHIISSLTSKKFITVLYSLTWLFILLLIVVLKPTVSESIVNALLWAIGGVFTAFVGGNTIGDHMGKSIKVEDNKSIEETKPTISEEIKK